MEKKKEALISRQVFIEEDKWKPFQILLVEVGLRKKDFTEDMVRFFHDKQGVIHNRSTFEYPTSISRTKPHETFQMKFTPEMMAMLSECLERAKERFPDEAESLSERRVLKAMFDEYFVFLERQKR